MQIGRAISNYSLNYEGFLPYAHHFEGPAGDHPERQRNQSAAATSCLALIYPRFLSQQRLFLCPGTHRNDAEDQPTIYVLTQGTYPSLTYHYSFGAAPQWSSYGYDRNVNPRKVSPKHVIVADMDGSWARDTEPFTSNHGGGQNVLRLDGSVKWETTNFCSDHPDDNIFTPPYGVRPQDEDTYIERP